MSLWLFTKMALGTHPSPNTENFSKCSGLLRNLRFDMYAPLRLRNWSSSPGQEKVSFLVTRLQANMESNLLLGNRPIHFYYIMSFQPFHNLISYPVIQQVLSMNQSTTLIQPSDIINPISSTRYQVSDIKYQILSIRYQASDIKYQLSSMR